LDALAQRACKEMAKRQHDDQRSSKRCSRPDQVSNRCIQVSIFTDPIERPHLFHMHTMIELRSVSKAYRKKHSVTALDSVNLAVAKGEMVAVMGPSGSGKSTLLNLVGGLDQPTSGEVLVDGTPLAGLSDDELARVRRDKIGIIFQFFNLLPTLSCKENVAIPLHLRGWPRAKIDERVLELLELVKLGARINHLPDELSGGERQRVAIARALSVYPPILLADEPTGNLDSSTGIETLKLIHDLHQRLSATVLLVTHDSSVAETCPRRITFRDGRIVQDVQA
jgi:putative ABC transport system ATP-binding protein